MNDACDACEYGQIRFVRYTQFAGTHYLCLGCAKEDPKYPNGDEDCLFKQVTFPVPNSARPESVGALVRG